jgi:hypothetical protein
LMLVPDVGMRNRYASEERRLYMSQGQEHEPGSQKPPVVPDEYE